MPKAKSAGQKRTVDEANSKPNSMEPAQKAPPAPTAANATTAAVASPVPVDPARSFVDVTRSRPPLRTMFIPPSIKAVVPELTVSNVPVVNDASLTGDGWYASRCVHNFVDIDSAFMHERGYVKSAILRAKKITFVVDPSRNPLLLYHGLVFSRPRNSLQRFFLYSLPNLLENIFSSLSFQFNK